jgi:CheY-like chemotaxis protein
LKAKILIIDDDTSLRRVLEYNLQAEGYEVQAASSGEEGLYLFGQSQPGLVITDMKMSGMDGLMVAITSELVRQVGQARNYCVRTDSSYFVSDNMVM